MAIPTILQGDSSGEITITLAEGHNYAGATLVVVFNGVSRQYTNLTAGGSVMLAFTADETAGMPLGTALVNMRLVGANGGVETVGNADARIKVTDCVAEVNAGGSFAVTPGGNPLDGVEGLGTRYTGDQLRAKINEVIAKLGGTVAALLLCALPCLGGVLDVHTAPFGTVYSDAPVVTNVNLDVHALTNGWKFSEPVDLTEATNYTDSALGAFASTGAVARATVYGTPTRWTDATGCVWEVSLGAWSVIHSPPLSEDDSFGGPEWASDESWGSDYFMGPGWYIWSSTMMYEIISDDPKLESYTREWYGNSGSNYVTTCIRPLSTNLVTRIAYTNDIPPATDLSPIEKEIADLRTESSLVYRLYSGSNVVAEVTNYNSQVHAPALRLLQLNESNEYITVWTETNGLARTLRTATDYADNAISTRAAPRGWSGTTSGLGADAPSNTTWISTPTTVIAGGLEYAKVVDTYGEVWVLSSNGMAAEFNPDTNAYFRISADDGTPVFSIEKTDAQVVGANAAGIAVGETSVTVPVPVVSQTSPTCFWRYSLAEGDWDDGTNAPQTWDFNWTGGTGAWVLTIDFHDTRPPSLFLRFSFLQEGGVVIRNSATTDISAGIWVNGVKFVPSVSGNNLIWTKQ